MLSGDWRCDAFWLFIRSNTDVGKLCPGVAVEEDDGGGGGGGGTLPLGPMAKKNLTVKCLKNS